jgi:prepilin-type N-terminal cleavage/methylation domain-containing protein
MTRTHSDDGFTLLEMVAAIAIVATSLLLAVPLLSSSSKTRVLQDATSALVAELDQARNRAMATGKPTTVSIDPVLRSYWTDGGFTATKLPRGMAIDRPDDSASGPMFLIFKPDGTATDATFGLRFGRSGARIGIDWVTGRVAVAFDR